MAVGILGGSTHLALTGGAFVRSGLDRTDLRIFHGNGPRSYQAPIARRHFVILRQRGA